MTTIGTVESIWRYPVKSMRGAELDTAFFGYAGVYGDRMFAFRSSDGEPGFPFLTGRENRKMLLYTPRFRDPDAAAAPPNLAAALALEPGISPIYANTDALTLDIETPGGETRAIDDPALHAELVAPLDDDVTLELLKSERAFTDCRPVSLISTATVAQIAGEADVDVDQRQFRANVNIALETSEGYGENHLLGKRFAIGNDVDLMGLEPDPRCAMITLNPDTAEANPRPLNIVSRNHGGMAGIYAAVLVEGMVSTGDAIRIVG